MIVVGAPTPGDVLQAQKPLRPQKETHGEGFKAIFEEAIWRDKEKTRAEDVQSVSGAVGESNIKPTLYATPAGMNGKRPCMR